MTAGPRVPGLTRDLSTPREAPDQVRGGYPGVEVRMSKDGDELVPGPDFDPAKLEALE